MLQFGIFLMAIVSLYSLALGYKIGDNQLNTNKKYIINFLIYVAVFMGTLTFVFNVCPERPVDYIDPIEVYRGNTSLKVTHIDGIPQDTIVILKTK